MQPESWRGPGPPQPSRLTPQTPTPNATCPVSRSAAFQNGAKVRRDDALGRDRDPQQQPLVQPLFTKAGRWRVGERGQGLAVGMVARYIGARSDVRGPP